MEYATALAARRIDDREFRLDFAGAAAADRRDAGAPRRRAAEQADADDRRRAAARRNGASRAGAIAAGAGRARNPGQPAPHGTGARRLLPRPQQARRARHARARQPTDRRRAEDAGARPRRAPARALPAADRRVREAGCRGSQRRSRDAGRIAVGSRLLHRGRRAAAAGSRPSDRPRCSIAVLASRPARPPPSPRPSRRRSSICDRALPETFAAYQSAPGDAGSAGQAVSRSDDAASTTPS